MFTQAVLFKTEVFLYAFRSNACLVEDCQKNFNFTCEWKSGLKQNIGVICKNENDYFDHQRSDDKKLFK